MTAVSPSVVDATALAALAFQESQAQVVGKRLDGVDLLAPPLLAAEVTNIAWKKCRRDPASAELVAGQLGEVLLVPVSLVRVDHIETLQLALLWGLTVYDASYLWVAWSRGVPLVTLDRRLAVVAAELGLS